MVKHIMTALMFLMITCTTMAQTVVVKKRFPPRGRTVVKVHNPVRVVHRDVTLHYSRGVFYRPVRRGYVVVAPPVGLRIAVLPPYYARVVVRGMLFFYCNGVFYQKTEDDTETYVVVKPPIGAKVKELPEGYTIKLIDGKKYYVVDNTYYAEVLSDNKMYYEVVQPPQQVTSHLMIGARLPHLPESHEVKVIDNQKYYLANGIYFKEIIESDTIWYEAVGEEK